MSKTPEQPTAHPRMTDVAKLAGVSLKSVSRVINGESHVSAKLNEKVQAAIRELAYVPDTAARSLAGARSFTIGILFDNPSPSYTMKIQSGAYDACRAAGNHLRIDHLDTKVGDEELDRSLISILQGSRVDGYVLTPPLTDNRRILDRLEALSIPYSRIAPVIDLGRSPAVDFDDHAAARAIADHLINLHHRRFGFISGPAHHGRAPHRREGFVSRIRERLPDAVVMEEYGTFHFVSGLEAGRRLLAAPKPPTAIFAANDDMAAGVISAAMQMGRKVPDELSVVGFDDSWITQAVWPPLTTVHQPIGEMARIAVDLLLRKEPVANGPIQLDFSLIERSSSTVAPGSAVKAYAALTD